MHANIGSCTIFAASSGSSVATAATVGTVAYPEIEARCYNESLFLGSSWAGGTLGILVPPSINLILYGLLTDTSVPELYLAGIIPGLILSGLFMSVIVIACLFRKDWGGQKVETSWGENGSIAAALITADFAFSVCRCRFYLRRRCNADGSGVHRCCDGLNHCGVFQNFEFQHAARTRSRARCGQPR